MTSTIKPRGKYKALKWIGGILVVLLLLIGGAALYLSARWKPLLSEKIKTGVYEGSKHLYKIEFKDIRLNLLSGSAALTEVRLSPDTAVFAGLKRSNTAPAHLFVLRLERLNLSHLKILRAYFNKKVDLRSILLEHPSIDMIHYNVPKKKDTLKDDRSLYELLPDRLASVSVKEIKIIDADFNYINGETSKTLNTVKHLYVDIKDILIDSLSQHDTSRFYYTKDIGFKLGSYKSLSKNKMYTIKTDTVSGSIRTGKLRVKNFQMIPMYPDLTFTRKFKYGKDRYDLAFDLISMEGIDFIKAIDEGRIYARSLTLGPAKAKIFVNRELPPPPGLDKVRNFPHMAVRRIPVPTIVDTVKIDRVDIAYTEYNPISEKRGTIYFDKLSGHIVNVSNDSVRLSKDHHARADLSALVMKKSKINVHIDFNLEDKNASFSYKGQIGPMNLMILNPMAANMGLVEIESGSMQKADFDINANRYGSSGLVHFYYKDLKVKLLKGPEDGEPRKKKGFLSFLANTILIKNSNPDKGDAPRSSRISFERTPAASFFNLMWKSVFLGIRETVGLGVVPMKTPEQARKKVKEKMQEKD